MSAVVVALLLWGNKYKNNSVHIWCDNAPTVGQLTKKSARFHREDIMKLVRIICTDTLQQEYHYFIDHIKGVKNQCADALSRFYKQPFQYLSSKQQEIMDKNTTNCLNAVKLCVASYIKAQR